MYIFTLSLFLSCSPAKEGETDLSSAHDLKKQKRLKPENKAVLDTKNVKTVPITLGSLTESALANGVTKANHEVVYSAEIPGKIEYLGFDLGDTVKKGRLLARIDFKTLKAQAEQAESNYNLAKTTYDRLSKLRSDELISQQQFDEVRSRMISAKAQVQIVKANLSKSSIKATHYGVVANKYIKKSEFIGPGTPIHKLVDYRKSIIEAQVAESQVAALSDGSAVKVKIGAFDENFEGTLDTILPAADPVSKTFTVRVKIDNPDLKILVGMSARLLITAKTYKDVLVIPQNAVLEEQNGSKSIFVAVNNRAERRIVTLGPTEKGDVMLKEGGSTGEQLIIMGQRDLVDGQPINIIR